MIELTGEPFGAGLPSRAEPWRPTVTLGLRADRAELIERLDAPRARDVAGGLLDEVAALLPAGLGVTASPCDRLRAGDRAARGRARRAAGDRADRGPHPALRAAPGGLVRPLRRDATGSTPTTPTALQQALAAVDTLIE